jgi:hypothetical protein
MKFLKQFESEGKPYKITYVDFRGDSDGVEALYIDGELYFYSWEYFNDWFGGFSSALDYFEIDYQLDSIEIKNRDLINSIYDGEPIPQDLEEIIIEEEKNKFKL